MCVCAIYNVSYTYITIKHAELLRFLFTFASCTISSYFYLGKSSNLWIILEYCPHGNLLNFLRSSRNFYDVDEEILIPDCYKLIGPKSLMYFAWQIAKGLTFLISRKVERTFLISRKVERTLRRQ